MGAVKRGWTVIELEVVLITAHEHALLGCQGWYNMLTPPSLNICENRHERVKNARKMLHGTPGYVMPFISKIDFESY